MKNVTVLDGLIAWRDDILKKEVLRKSKIGYLCHMVTLIDFGLFDLEQPLSEFVKNDIEGKLRQIKESDCAPFTKQTRCTILRSFFRFIQQKKIKPANIVIPFERFRDLRAAVSELFSSNADKAQPLKTTDIVKFLRAMCEINPRDALVCWLAWEIKATVHQVLDLLVNDVDLDGGIIRLNNGLRIGDIRDDLKQCIIEQSKGKDAYDLLFTTTENKRIHAGQLSRNMKVASKRTDLPVIISPKILNASAKLYGEQAYLAMKQQDRNRLSAKYQKKIESYIEKTNKKSLHNNLTDVIK